MKKFKDAKYKVFSVVLCSLFFVSCASSDVDDKIEGVKLNRGAVIQNQSGTYSNYNMENGEMNKIENEELIGLYDKESGRYITQVDDGYNLFSNDKITKLNHVALNDANLKLSPKGKYLSYFSEEDGIQNLKVLSLEDNDLVNINTDIAISSYYSFLEWIDDENIVYYGVNSEKVNGIFIYNLKEKKESVFYKLKSGIIQFIKNLDAGVICIEATLDDKKYVKLLDKEGNEQQVISDNVTQMMDIISVDDKYYFLGKVKGNNLSIYKYADNSIKRVVFDFPQEIDVDKGLSKDEDGNILFIGKENAKSNEEQVYKLTQDGTISIVSENSKEYQFVKYQ